METATGQRAVDGGAPPRLPPPSPGVVASAPPTMRLPTLPQPQPASPPNPGVAAPLQSPPDMQARQAALLAGTYQPPKQRGRSWSRAFVIVAALAVGAAGMIWGRDLVASTPPHPDQWDARVADIATFVEGERDLTFDHPVYIDFLTEAEYVGLFDDDNYEVDDATRAEYNKLSDVYDAAGLAVGYDLLAGRSSVAAVTTLGFYSPDTDRIIVRGDTMTPAVRVVVAHELVHALQEQNFDFTLGGQDDLARRSIIEADASRVEAVYRATLSEADQASASKDNSLTEQSEQALQEVPSALVETSYAPYVLGPMLLRSVFELDGNAGVDELLRTPPKEEILINPWLHGTGQVEVDADIEVPTGSIVIEPPQPLSMLDTLAMLDAWLPWTQARGALDGWAGGGYVSYEQSESDPTVCFTASVAFDGSTENFEAALTAWAAASGSSAQPTVLKDRVWFESCARGAGAANPPAPDISLTQAIFLENTAFEGIGQNPTSADVASRQCLARVLIDDPTVAPLLLKAQLSPEEIAQVDALRAIALPECNR